MTYGMNNGPKTFRPNFWSCVDAPERFLKSIWMDPKIMKFVPFAHFEKPIFDNEKWEMTNMVVGSCPNVVGFRRNEKFVADRFLFEDTINWGNHKDYGGGRSVFLPVLRIAFLLGFRNVYLIGVDFQMSENYTYHFDEQRSKGAVNCNKGTYDRMSKEYLPQLKPYFDAEEFHVFNCSKESGLKVFPYVNFDDAIKDMTSALGDVKNERTWGLYCKPEEREKWKQEPDAIHKQHLSNITPKADNKCVKKERIVSPQTSTMTHSLSKTNIDPVISIDPTPNVVQNVIAEDIVGIVKPAHIEETPHIVKWDNNYKQPMVIKESKSTTTAQPSPKNTKINPRENRTIPKGYSVSQGIDGAHHITLPDA